MARVDADLTTIVDTNVAALTLGTNLFVSPERPVSTYIPAKSCFIFMPTGGPAPTVYADGGSGSNFNMHSVQAIIRCTAQDLSEGRDLADSVYTNTRKCVPANTQGCLANSSAPIYLGEDEKGHHRFSINYTIFKKE